MFNKNHLGYLLRDISWMRRVHVLEYKLRSRGRKLRGPFPLFAKVELDQRCNLNCEMCQRTKIVSNTHLTLENFKYIIDKLGSGLVQCDIHGYGESLINKNWPEMFEYLNKKGILIGCVTNGTLLDSDEIRRKILSYHPRRIRFSIDAADKETFERIRRGADFDKVKTNFTHLVELRNEMYPTGRNRPSIDIYCTLTTKLLSQIEPMIKLKDEWHADMLTFSDIAWNNQFGTSTFENSIRENLRFSEIDKIINDHKRKDVLFHIRVDDYRTCDYPMQHIYVDATGDIYPCTCTPGFIKPLGNIYKINNIREFYQSKVYNDFRYKSKLGTEDSHSCRRCLQWSADCSKL